MTTPPSQDDIDTRTVRRLVYATLQLLLVEDDELVRTRLELILSKSNFDVCAVASVAEARSAMEALVFPIVIIDRKLSDGDGLDLITELRKHYVKHRVYLMLYSALDSDEERNKGLLAGADAYLSKGATDEELLAKLALARRKIDLRSQ